MATKKKIYSFTDHPQHKAELDDWAKKWIANALNCEPMTEDDRAAMRIAINGMHRAANLAPLPDDRIIFVSSPITGAIAASVAGGVWWIREHRDDARRLFKHAYPVDTQRTRS